MDAFEEWFKALGRYRCAYRAVFSLENAVLSKENTRHS
jgi:hypothetical protein